MIDSNNTSQTRRAFLHKSTALAAGATASALGVIVLSGDHRLQAQQVVVRRNIVTMQRDFPDEFARFQEATRILRSRSQADPTGWFVNGEMHRFFCSTFPINSPQQVHFGWWFLPWHRAFLWVTEKKLQAALGEVSFGLPYWNWRADRAIPDAYKGSDNPLDHERRFERSFPLTDGEVSLNAMRRTNFTAEWAPGRPPPPTFGGLPRPDPFGRLAFGQLEASPHGDVHVYVGGEDAEGNPGDMSVFETAAQDPTFFGHHGNIDRVWESWRADPARRASEPANDPVFLTKEFNFVGADGLPVGVSVADTLNTLTLGYIYDELEPIPGPQITPMLMVEGARTEAAIPPAPPIAQATVAVPERVRALGPSAFAQGGESQQVFLTIQGIEMPPESVTVRVYLEPATGGGEPSLTPANLSGTFSIVRTMLAPEERSGTFDVNVDITEALARLGTEAENLRVTLVPVPFRAGKEYAPLSFRSIQLQVSRP